MGVSGYEYPELNGEQIEWIGDQIFNNECRRLPACLTSWNEGETFPSLGIGHFIWYQAEQEEIFEESFPKLLSYLENEGITIPSWIEAGNFESPWANRSTFLSEFDSSKMTELRTFLAQHTREQTGFIINRFDSALGKMLDSSTSGEYENQSELSQVALEKSMQENFYSVANSSAPYGLYALIDYVNFKGTGASLLESYQGKGWGLKQVLLGMDSNKLPLQAFIQSARDTLNLRVQNAPAARNESRWLTGWNNRLDTYRFLASP